MKIIIRGVPAIITVVRHANTKLSESDSAEHPEVVANCFLDLEYSGVVPQFWSNDGQVFIRLVTCQSKAWSNGRSHGGSIIKSRKNYDQHRTVSVV